MSKLWVIGILVVILIMSCGLLSQADEWTFLGPRAQAMGGAGVAVGDGATAFYWNPAALYINEKIGLTIPFGLTLGAEGDIIQQADLVAKTIDGMDWATISAKIDSGQNLATTDVQKLLDLYINKIPRMDEKGQGLVANGSGALSFTIKNIGIFANVMVNGAADPVVDLKTLNLSVTTTAVAQVQNVVGNGNDQYANGSVGSNLSADVVALTGGIFTQNQAEELVKQAELAGVPIASAQAQQMIKNLAVATATLGGLSAVKNQSGIILSGAVIQEIGVSYGYPLLGKTLSIGGNLKYMSGKTYYNFIKYDAIKSGKDISEDITKKENTKESSTFGLDLGLLWNLTDNFHMGLTGRNLNKPKFAYAGAGDYELDPQMRVGACFNLGRTVVLGIDSDLTTNKTTALDGYESKLVGAGIEFRVPILAISARAGAYKNTASSTNDDMIYTGGIGLHLFILDLDLAGAMSTSKANLEAGSGGEDMRDRYAVSGSLALRF